MHTMTSTEFARNPRAVYDRVLETQEAVEITRHGKPVVRVEPVRATSARRQMSGREIADMIEASAKRFGQVSDPTWQKDYDEWINPYEPLDDPWSR